MRTKLISPSVSRALFRHSAQDNITIYIMQTVLYSTSMIQIALFDTTDIRTFCDDEGNNLTTVKYQEKVDKK